MPSEIIKRHVVANRRKAGGSVTDTVAQAESAEISGTELGRAIEQTPSFRFFWDNEITIERTSELTKVGFGVAGADELHITRASGGLYHEALLKKLRENCERIDEGLPDQELARRFEDFQKREAKLPELLAQKRG